MCKVTEIIILNFAGITLNTYFFVNIIIKTTPSKELLRHAWITSVDIHPFIAERCDGVIMTIKDTTFIVS